MAKPFDPLRALRAAALMLGAALAGCAGAAPGPLTYTYPPTLPTAYTPHAALGAVAFRNGPHIDLYLPAYHGDANRRPERFTFRPTDDQAATWIGHPYRLPHNADIVARLVEGAEAFPDTHTGRRVALLPPGALAVAFPADSRYGDLAGRTIFLVPAGTGTRTSQPPEAAFTAWKAPR